MRSDLARSVLGSAALLLAAASPAAGPALQPGLYQVEARIALPNVAYIAPPITLARCIEPDDLLSGQAFSVLSDNPLRQCAIADYQASANAARYRIECAGPNRGSASAAFDIRPSSYRGVISMNMGGKNMTLSETQTGTRIGACR